MKTKRIVFFGTPEFAVDILEGLTAADITPTLVVTSPDMPKGRKLILTPPDVKLWALEHDIELIQPNSLKDDPALDLILNTEWDLFIVASYGKIIPKAILDIPKYGTLNVHPSMLPRFRGASPIRSAILEDQRDAVGVSIMLLDEEMDHGPLIAQASVTIDEWPPHALILEKLLAHEGGKLLAEVIPLWIRGEITPEEQDHDRATFCGKITKDMGEIDLKDDPYKNLLKIRAFEGWPGTYFFTKKNEKRTRVKIIDAELTPDNSLQINTVIPEGKNEMPYADFLR